MSDTFTNRLGLQQPLSGGDAGTWGQTLNTDLAALDDAIAGTAPINLAGLTSYALTAVQGQQGALYQARYQIFNFTGQINSPCTVTIPQVARVGWAINNTSGTNNVTLTTGGGSTLTLPPNGVQVFFSCDGVNVTSPALQAGPTTVNTSGGYLPLFGGYLIQFGKATSNNVGFLTVSFTRSFSAAPFVYCQSANLNAVVNLNTDPSFVNGPTGFTAQSQSINSSSIAPSVLFNWLAIGPQ